MPSSRPEIIPVVVNCIVNFNPESILDIGCGSGKYGFLARDYLENRDESSLFRKPEEWKVRVDGIEGFSGYINPVTLSVYSTIVCGDAMDVIDSSLLAKSYDLILCIEMIEHCEKDYGRKLLALMTEKAKKGVVVSTPVSPEPQGIIHGNELERHISKWEERDFPTYPFWEFHRIANGRFLVAVFDKEKWRTHA